MLCPYLSQCSANIHLYASLIREGTQLISENVTNPVRRPVTACVESQ